MWNAPYILNAKNVFSAVEYPITCEEGELKIYDLNADTYIANDGAVHGGEQWLYVGNSGWDGKVRSLVDFDISTFNTDLTELFDETQSVYLRMWYDGVEMGKPYNDPRQIDRNVVAHKVRFWGFRFKIQTVWFYITALLVRWPDYIATSTVYPIYYSDTCFM